MDNQTIIVTVILSLALLFILWRCYIALRRYSCCGSCGCDLMTKKERKAFDARNASLVDQEKGKP
jgi:hypothetical protein